MNKRIEIKIVKTIIYLISSFIILGSMIRVIDCKISGVIILIALTFLLYL